MLKAIALAASLIEEAELVSREMACVRLATSPTGNSHLSARVRIVVASNVTSAGNERGEEFLGLVAEVTVSRNKQERGTIVMETGQQ